MSKLSKLRQSTASDAFFQAVVRWSLKCREDRTKGTASIFLPVHLRGFDLALLRI